MTQNTRRAPKGKALFKFTAPDGEDYYRASGTMAYTHAVWGDSLTWHTSYPNALKAASTRQHTWASGRTGKVIPVEIVEDRR